MSRENMEIVRAAVDAWNRGDWGAALTDAAPGFTLDNSRAAGPNRGVYRLDQMHEFWDEFADSWESYRMEPHEFIEAGDHIVVPVAFRAVGRGGIEVEARPTWSVTIRDGAIECIRMHQEREDALEAVGAENVELGYRLVDAFNRRAFDAFVALMDDDVEVFPHEEFLEGRYHGRDGVRRWCQNLIDAFPDWRAEPLEARDLGDLTVGKLHFCGHGGESGAPVDRVIWQVVRWRDWKIVRFSSHDTETDALEAAGLEE